MTSTSVLGTTQITLQFDLDRNIDAAALDVQAAIDAAAGQLPKNLPSPPTYRKINPADSPILILAVQSDVLPLTEVNDYADNVLAQQICADPRRRPGDGRRPAEAGGARPDRSGQDRRGGPAARGRRAASSPPPRSTSPRARSTGWSRTSRSTQRPAAEGRALERRDPRLPQRRADPRARRRRRRRRPGEQQGPRLARTASSGVHAAGHHQAAGRQRHRDRRPVKAALPRV